MLEYIKKNKVLLSICGILAVLLVACGCILCKMHSNKSIMQANLEAATQEMTELKTKNGDLLVERQSYVGTIDELQGMITTSKAEIKDLQKTLNSKILYISKLENEINITPTEVHDTTVVYKDSCYIFSFNFKDSWYNLNGHSQVNQYQAKTWIDNIHIDVPLTVGLTEDWKIFVTSSNPYVNFNSIEGAVLDKNAYLNQKKVKHWGFTVSAGLYGGYNLVGNKGMYIGPGFGIGGSYMF